MKRRRFFQSIAAGGGMLTVAPYINACSQKANENKSLNSHTRDFELDEVNISDLQEMLRTGNSTSVELVKKYKQRIKEIDKSGPTLRAIIELNPDAENIAVKLDEERGQGKIRGPLHGIPIVIKDNIDSADQMATSAGSMALANFKAQNDAFIVKRLRENGAILLGKTNLSEWANFRSTNSSSGWSGRGGQVKNPYVLDRTPCGSSSGSAAAVAANLCAIAIGTETDGSIVCPSAINGVVGLKPTLGLWSRSGIIPIAFSQDTAGPITRNVKDAATLLGALIGTDENDSETKNSETYRQSDYTKHLAEDGLTGSRIGVLKNFFGFDSRVDEIMEQSIQKMRDSGAIIIDNLEYLPKNDIGNFEWEVLLYEFKHSLNDYFKNHPNSPVKNLEELIEFNKQMDEQEMPWFSQEIFGLAQAKGDLSSEEYITAVVKSKAVSQKVLDGLIKEHQLDSLIAPTNGPAWKIDYVNGDNFGGGSSSPAAVSGYPSITVPAGYIHNLPIGISFIGKAWSEPTLLKLAYSFEQKTKIRRKPQFIESIEIL